MRMPPARGPVGEVLARHLGAEAGPAPDLVESTAAALPDGGDAVVDDDLQLALASCYELHYRGLEGVDERWEWEPSLLAARACMEDRFESALRTAVPVPPCSGDVAADLRRLVLADPAPSLSRYLMRAGTVDEFREFVAQRSVYHLKEADPHTWAIPRLADRAKAALVEIQSDEYGGGRPERMHQVLFGATMRALGLDDTYGHYWPAARGVTLATVNLMSLLGLHRRSRGALAGHLAALEMTSTAPNRRYGNGLRRLGFGPDATAFYDVHVEADAVHEQLAAVDLCGSLVAAEPALHGDVLWGAACALHVEGRFAAEMLAGWSAAAPAVACA